MCRFSGIGKLFDSSVKQLADRMHERGFNYGLCIATGYYEVFLRSGASLKYLLWHDRQPMPPLSYSRDLRGVTLGNG